MIDLVLAMVPTKIAALPPGIPSRAPIGASRTQRLGSVPRVKDLAAGA
jgi:hypothetical protein